MMDLEAPRILDPAVLATPGQVEVHILDPAGPHTLDQVGQCILDQVAPRILDRVAPLMMDQAAPAIEAPEDHATKGPAAALPVPLFAGNTGHQFSNGGR